MVVVDTNVLVYLLIEGDRTAQAQMLFARDADWRSEAFILVEFSNVLATFMRAGALSAPQGERLLRDAERCMRGLVSVPHGQALGVASEFALSAYDARFVAVARRLRAKLVTEDAKLRGAAPSLTLSIAEAIGDG